MITFSKLQFFHQNYSSTPNPSFLLFDHIGVGVCFVVMATAAGCSWFSCYINNFYGKVSSVDGQLLLSNIIDSLRFLEEL